MMYNKINTIREAVKKPDQDIYCGNENLTFRERHPIYKTLMKLEFEDILRNFQHKNRGVNNKS